VPLALRVLGPRPPELVRSLPPPLEPLELLEPLEGDEKDRQKMQLGVSRREASSSERRSEDSVLEVGVVAVG
jgi:hypothetical protein